MFTEAARERLRLITNLGNSKEEMQTPTPITPLSTAQERRLVDYLDEQFLELTRGYKKRLISRDLFQSLRIGTHTLSGSTGRTPRASSQRSRNILKPLTTSLT